MIYVESHKSFNFDESIFFSVVTCGFGVIAEKLLHNPKSQKCMPSFSLRVCFERVL
jgi:hypothetical protein